MEKNYFKKLGMSISNNNGKEKDKKKNGNNSMTRNEEI